MEKNSNTLVSIIMATYNRARLIGGTLESVQKQTFGNWECLIIDDGSADNTEEIVRSYSSSDKRFKYYQRDGRYRKGLSGSRNQGLDHAEGKYIIFYDDDDYVHPENLETCLASISAGDAAFCRYDKQPFWGKWKSNLLQPVTPFTPYEFEQKDLFKMISGEIPFASCCVLWDKKCFKENRFNEELMYAEEWECYSRILSEGFQGVSIDQVLYFNRKHAGSNTGEFQAGNPIRKKSKIKAAVLIVQNLSSKNLLKPVLQKFFIKMGVDLRAPGLIDLVLEKSGSGKITRLKYSLGLIFYPVLKPVLKLRGKFLKGF